MASSRLPPARCCCTKKLLISYLLQHRLSGRSLPWSKLPSCQLWAHLLAQSSPLWKLALTLLVRHPTTAYFTDRLATAEKFKCDTSPSCKEMVTEDGNLFLGGQETGGIP